MLTLYYSPGACSLAPHVLLEELGLEFELRRVVVAERENFSPDYLRINPRGRVPTLAAGGELITEVPAILVYLASLRPEAGVLPPAGSIALARALELAAWLSSTLHIAYAQLWRPERFLPDSADPAVLVDHARPLIERCCAEVETRLVGPWAIGESWSIADAYLLPFYRWGNRIGLAMSSDYPRWAGWTRRMLDRPAVARAIATEGIAQFD